jgi:hypothetical protein
MGKLKMFVIGIVVGSMLTGGLSFASNRALIEVLFPVISYWYDGKEMVPKGQDDKPLTIHYNGTNYVPARFIAEALGKDIEWDAKNSKIHIRDVTYSKFEIIEQLKEEPEHIRAWVESYKGKELAQLRIDGSSTYILVTRGEKTTGGFDVDISAIRNYSDKMVVDVKYTDPPKGSLLIEKLTYPYTLVKLNRVYFQDVEFIEERGGDIPEIIGMSYGLQAIDSSDHIILFQPIVKDHEILLRGLVRSFEGILFFSLLDGDGNELEVHPIQAASGDPNWGVFIKSIDPELIGAAEQVMFHTVNPKDGSKRDVLTLSIKEYK